MWCQFCFELNTIVVVELHVCIYEEVSLLIGADFDVVNTLSFEEREKF